MSKEINVVPNSKKECCGCGICTKICPKDAIEIIYDDEGFMYPKVNKNKCIDCGICINNCAFYNTNREQSTEIEKAYLIKHKIDNIRLNSRSGGVFVACSDWILKNNGVVYGCILDKNMKVIHVRAENKEERNQMCKSKYAQSDMKDVIKKVEKDLEQGKKVLFSGTGCQVDAIINYLEFKKVNIDNFFTIDIICHGVASPLIFNDYIKWLEHKYNAEVTDFDFRDKNIGGWASHVESAIIKDKKYKLSYYREIFHTDLCIRPSCYNCKYTKVKRNSDLTIGDAWGIKNEMPNFDDNKGVSIVIVQNKKGKELINNIRDNCELEEVDIQKFMQLNLKQPSKPKGDRDEFWKIYNEQRIDGIIKKYGTVPTYKKIGSAIKYKIRKIKYGKEKYFP